MATKTMEITVQPDDGAAWAAVKGRVDGSTAQQFHEQAMAAGVGSATSLVLDMTELSFISSAGLRTILVLTKHFNANGGKLVLCGLPAQIRETFNISGFDKIVPIAEDRDAARGMLK